MRNNTMWLRAMDRDLPAICYEVANRMSEENAEKHFTWLATAELQEVYDWIDDLREYVRNKKENQNARI